MDARPPLSVSGPEDMCRNSVKQGSMMGPGAFPDAEDLGLGFRVSLRRRARPDGSLLFLRFLSGHRRGTGWAVGAPCDAPHCGGLFGRLKGPDCSACCTSRQRQATYIAAQGVCHRGGIRAPA